MLIVDELTMLDAEEAEQQKDGKDSIVSACLGSYLHICIVRFICVHGRLANGAGTHLRMSSLSISMWIRCRSNNYLGILVYLVMLVPSPSLCCHRHDPVVIGQSHDGDVTISSIPQR